MIIMAAGENSTDELKRQHQALKSAVKSRIESIDSTLALDLLRSVNQSRDKGASSWLVCPDRNDAVAFIDWKKFYWDSKALVANIVAHWPRATHDSRIFDNSTIAEQFRNGSINGLFVGDSGYACRSYLMISLLNPRNDAEVRYNDAQRRTRIVIERCFGIVKRRFLCLGCVLLEILWLSL